MSTNTVSGKASALLLDSTTSLLLLDLTTSLLLLDLTVLLLDTGATLDEESLASGLSTELTLSPLQAAKRIARPNETINLFIHTPFCSAWSQPSLTKISRINIHIVFSGESRNINKKSPTKSGMTFRSGSFRLRRQDDAAEGRVTSPRCSQACRGPRWTSRRSCQP